MSDMTSVIGKFDHYFSDSDTTNEADEVFLSNGKAYYIIFNDIQTPWHSAFDKIGFLANVKKGQTIDLLVRYSDRCDEILMIKSDGTTYMLFQDATATARINYTLDAILTGIFALLGVSCLFLNILHRKAFKTELDPMSPFYRGYN